MAYTRKSFTDEEDRRMIEFLVKEARDGNPDAKTPGGNRLWRKAYAQKVTPHPVQAMRDRFRRTLYPLLYKKSSVDTIISYADREFILKELGIDFATKPMPDTFRKSKATRRSGSSNDLENFDASIEACGSMSSADEFDGFDESDLPAPPSIENVDLIDQPINESMVGSTIENFEPEKNDNGKTKIANKVPQNANGDFSLPVKALRHIHRSYEPRVQKVVIETMKDAIRAKELELKSCLDFLYSFDDILQRSCETGSTLYEAFEELLRKQSIVA